MELGTGLMSSAPTIRACGRSFSTRTGGRVSRSCPRRRRRSRCSPAGSAARTSRSSARAPAGTCSGTRWSRASTAGARRARPPPAVRRVRALPRRARVDVRAVRASRRSCPAGSPSACTPTEGVELPGLASTTRAGRWSSRSRACCAAPTRVPRGRVLVVGNGFVGRLFGAVLERRGDEVFAVDADPAPRRPRAGRAGRRGGRLRARRRRRRRSRRSSPAARCSSSPTRGELPADAVYRRELTRRRLALGDARRRCARRARCSPSSTLPEPVVLPLERFAEGLELFRPARGAEGRLRAVRALRFYGPGDLRIEDVPDPEPGAGRRARAGRGRAHRRHRPEGVPPRAPAAARRAAAPVRPRVLRHRRRDRPPRRRGELGAVRRVRGVRARRRDAVRAPAAAAERRLRRAARRPGADRAREPPTRCRPASRPRSRRSSSRSRAACTASSARASRPARRSRSLGAGPIGLMLCACVADAGGRPVVVGGRARAARARARRSARSPATATAPTSRSRRRARRRAGATRSRSCGRGGTVVFFSGLPAGTEVALDAYRIHYEELTLRGAFHHTPRTVRAALAFLASGARPWERLLTHEVGARGVCRRSSPTRRDGYLKASSGREERQVGLALAAEQREVDLDAADAARLRERDRLRLDLLRGEDAAAAGLRRVLADERRGSA